MQRKICAITGSRSEYGIIRPVMQAIKDSPALDLSVVVTGMHLSHHFGYTVSDIEDDGFTVDAMVDMMLDGSRGISMAKSVGLGIIGIAQALEKIDPDVILIVGDRIEALAAAIAATYMNLVIAHIHGGDRSIGGHADDTVRHAITKLAHLHFAASEQSARRILHMGELESYVFTVGAPALDSIRTDHMTPPLDVCQKYGMRPNERTILVIQNPVTREFSEAGSQMRETLEAVKALGHRTIVIYPNADIGGREMVDIIKEYEKYPFITAFMNVPHQDYLGLLNKVDVLVGNSSSAIIEAPSFGLPVVNIGTRQMGRERADNVIDAPYDRMVIRECIEKALLDTEYIKTVKKCVNPYGDGRASERIVTILKELDINEDLLKKQITY